MAASGVMVTWFWLMLMGGVGSLGGAPLPLDPTLSAVAPEKCLWYASFSGRGPADAASKNQTEQLFAEPQVQQFIAAIESQILKAVRRGGGPGREQRVLAAEVPKLIKAVLTRPLALYVEEVAPKERGIDAEGAIILNAGDQKAEVESALAELLKLGPPLMKEPQGGVEWSRLPTPPEAPQVRLGWKENYFIIAIGAKTPNSVLARMKGSAGPAWLTEIRKEHPIKREISLGYLNVAGVLERAKPLIQAREPEAWGAIEKLGFTHVQALHGVTGFDETACTSMGHIVTDGQRAGVLSLLPYKPLTEADLQLAPKDALVALALKLDPAEVWTNAIAMAKQFHPQAEEELDRELWEIENQLGINVREDVVGALGDSWVVYVPGGDLMSSWLNAAAAVRVKDGARLRGAAEKLISVAKAEIERSGEATIVESKVGDHKIYTLQFAREPIPVAPSWSIGDDWLAFGLLPQGVRSALDRKLEDSLAKSATVGAALKQKGGAASLFYQDTPQIVRSAYPFLQMGATMAAGQLRQAGIEFDPSSMPSLDVIFKHLQPGISTMTHGSDGFHFTSRHSLPGEGNIAAAAPIAVALFLPAVGSARGAAREAQDMNNMKQIMLAALNHESATRAYPADVSDDEGKPQLSWRVKILPYIEQQALYQQFHMDEPWDSEHNRALIAQMPAVYRSPEDAPDVTKTRYLAVKGADTVFPGDKGVRISNVTDGTSNTIFVVQSTPDRAVEWTKPGDWELDAEDAFAGLGSPRGHFLAGFCDGSVRRLSLAIGDEVLKALVTRGGGEVINREQLDVPPAPEMYEPEEDAAAAPAVEFQLAPAK